MKYKRRNSSESGEIRRRAKYYCIGGKCSFKRNNSSFNDNVTRARALHWMIFRTGFNKHYCSIENTFHHFGTNKHTLYRRSIENIAFSPTSFVDCNYLFSIILRFFIVANAGGPNLTIRFLI